MHMLFLSSLQTANESAETPWWVWLLVFVVLAAAFLAIIWWYMSRPLGKDEQQAHVTETGAAAAGLELSGPPVEVKAAGFPPAPSAPDDLKIIEGIGPKISGVLQAAGISTFAQLAAADTGRIRQILEQANPNLLRLADPATWPEQAALAAAGKMEELRALQDGLKGGRER